MGADDIADTLSVIGGPTRRSGADDLLARLLAEARAEREPAPEPEPDPVPVTAAERMPFGADPADVVAAADDPVAVLLDIIGRARPAWQVDGACRGRTDLEWTHLAPATWRPTAQLQVCGTCGVRIECRNYADQIGDVNAVLGGECPSARRARWRASGRRRSTDPMPTTDPEEAHRAET